MTVSAVFGLVVIPALVGAVVGWIYWRAAGRPSGGKESPDESR